MMAHWLQTGGESWRRFSATFEDLYKNHVGLLVFLGVVFGGIQALLAYVGVAKRKTAAEGSQPIDPSVRRDLLDKVETEWVHGRLHQGLRKLIRVDLKLTETLDAVRPGLRIH